MIERNSDSFHLNLKINSDGNNSFNSQIKSIFMNRLSICSSPRDAGIGVVRRRSARPEEFDLTLLFTSEHKHLNIRHFLLELFDTIRRIRLNCVIANRKSALGVLSGFHPSTPMGRGDEGDECGGDVEIDGESVQTNFDETEKFEIFSEIENN